jgi:hypothetical protein
VDLAAYSTGAIDTDGVGKYLERQSPRLVAIEHRSHRQIAQSFEVPRQALSNRAFDDCFQERAVLVLQAHPKCLCEQHGSAC